MSKINVGSVVLAGAVMAAGFVIGRQSVNSAGNTALAAQPEPKKDAKPGGQPAGQPEAMPPGMMPGPMHEHLRAFAGTWEGGVKFKAGEEWHESKGTVRRELSMDGRFIIEHVDAEGMAEGQRYKAIGLFGYNTIENKFESAWVDNMNTAIVTETGQFDAKTKVFTFQGEAFDPMIGQKVKRRSTVDVSNPNRHTMVGYTIMNGKEEKTFEGVFERTAGSGGAR